MDFSRMIYKRQKYGGQFRRKKQKCIVPTKEGNSLIPNSPSEQKRLCRWYHTGRHDCTRWLCFRNEKVRVKLEKSMGPSSLSRHGPACVANHATDPALITRSSWPTVPHMFSCKQFNPSSPWFTELPLAHPTEARLEWLLHCLAVSRLPHCLRAMLPGEEKTDWTRASEAVSLAPQFRGGEFSAHLPVRLWGGNNC